MTRYLRFAVAGIFVVLAVAFVALWVRSYYWTDIVGKLIVQRNSILLVSGLGIVDCRLSIDDVWHEDNYRHRKMPAGHGEVCHVMDDDCPHGFGFVWNSGQGSTLASAPHWFLIAVFAIPAAWLAMPLFKWRLRLDHFSIREMLIVTAIIAAVFGLAAYVYR